MGFIAVANTMSPGPISCTVGSTSRSELIVMVHCTLYVSPAVTVESSGDIMALTSGAGRAEE